MTHQTSAVTFSLNLRQCDHLFVAPPPDPLAAAVSRYCAFRMRQNDQERADGRLKAVRALQSGLLLLGVTLASALIRRATTMPAVVLDFVAEGLSVLGWVGLWQPVDVLLHEWYPYRRSSRIYRRIQDMEIAVWPEPDP